MRDRGTDDSGVGAASWNGYSPKPILCHDARRRSPTAEAGLGGHLENGRSRAAALGERGRNLAGEPHPLLRSPAEMPLIVNWMPVSTFSLVECARCSFSNSTCT